MTLLHDDDRPLQGLEVIVTRAAHQSEALVKRLTSLGAELIIAPTIALDAPPPPSDSIYDRGTWMLPYMEAAEQLWRFDWLIFTSVNAVRICDKVWETFGGVKAALDQQAPSRESTRSRQVKVATVGSSTHRALTQLGVEVTSVPRQFHAEALLKMFEQEDLGNKRFLIPRALKARELLPEALRARGAEVWISPMYQTIQASLSSQVKAKIIAPLDNSNSRAILFTSDSTVDRLMDQLNDREQNLLRERCRAWVIGPVVKRAVERHGIKVTGVADPHTIDGLVECLIKAFTDKN